MITIRCRTRFDITPTGVMGSYRQNQSLSDVPDTAAAWTRSRNQQRNWDTMNQIIALRCLPENITPASRDGDEWWFEFDLPDSAAVSHQPGDLEFLRRDADGVPMITGLAESSALASVIRCWGQDANCWFSVRSDKYLRTGE